MVSNNPQVRIADIQRSMSRHGAQPGRGKMEYLHDKQPFCEALASGIGQELLSDLMIGMNQLLEKIIEEKATPEDLAEYRVYKRLFKQWSTSIVTYFKIADELKEIA